MISATIEVRNAQYSFAEHRKDITVVSRLFETMKARGLMKDSFHYYQAGYNEVGKDLSKVIANMNTMEERIEYVIRLIDQSCGLNIHAYLSKVLTLDMICLNEDRHLNNLALIMRGNDFYPAPIFDNGVSLLTANQSVNWNFFYRRKCKKSYSTSILWLS